jgi:hypothetical protein
MDARERDGFKEQLRAMAAGRGEGIDLASVDRWVIPGLKEPVPFFRQLKLLMPANSILYLEGTSIHPEVVRFYETSRAKHPVAVVRDTIFPIPETFHVSMTETVIDGLVELLGHHARPECFDHVKGYIGDTLLFTFHDAFDRTNLLVSDVIPESGIHEFTAILGTTYTREPNVNKRDPEVLRALFLAMENPQKLRMNWPWWKKAIFFWKRHL